MDVAALPEAITVHERLRQEIKREMKGAKNAWVEYGGECEWDDNRNRIDRRYHDYLKPERDYRARGRAARHRPARGARNARRLRLMQLGAARRRAPRQQ